MVGLVIKSEDFGDKLISDYLEVFDKYSFKNRFYGNIALHVVLGQALKNVYYKIGRRKIDIRVHFILIKPQGTGKGAGFGFCKKAADWVGLDFQVLSESTDGGLAGSKKYDSSQKKDIVVPGLLEYADIVAMEEASILIDFANEFSKKNMTYMQITMNPLEDDSCYINRRLVGLDISFKPHASFLLMSYPPDNIADKIVKTGFIDRMITDFEDVTLVDRLEVLKKITENSNLDEDEWMDREIYVKKRLQYIVKKFEKGSICINIEQEIHQAILQCIDEMATMILDASPKAREKLEHFITRLYEILVKLSIHHALLSNRTELRISDVLYARMTYLPIWRNLIISIESLLIISPEERFRRHTIKSQAIKEYKRLVKEGKFVKKDVWVRRATMVENLQPKWDHCSMSTADNNLSKLETLPKESYGKFLKVSQYEKEKIFKRKYFGETAYIKMI